MWFLVIAAAVTLPLLLYVFGRRSEQATLRDWDLVVGPKGAQYLEETRRYSEAQLALLDWTSERAAEARADGRHGQAIKLLEVGCRLIEDYCPNWRRSLAAMSVLARMVTAIEPLPAVAPRRFKTAELTHLARVGEFVHHFLVTTRERFQLRLMILGRGFQALLFVVLRTKPSVGRASPEWDAFEAARIDARALSNESVESVRVLFAALESGSRRSPANGSWA